MEKHVWWREGKSWSSETSQGAGTVVQVGDGGGGLMRSNVILDGMESMKFL